eukprot:COSAG02_NODE_59789_length_273_cov_0.597701_1_plen_91_part_11
MGLLGASTSSPSAFPAVVPTERKQVGAFLVHFAKMEFKWETCTAVMDRMSVAANLNERCRVFGAVGSVRLCSSDDVALFQSTSEMVDDVDV